MTQSPTFNYNLYEDKSENYMKLESLSCDVKNSWIHDCDETNSMKEIIEIINGIMIMDSIEDYFLNDKNDLNFFMGEFSKVVISNILSQPVIYGEDGDQIGLNLLFHYIKLFMKFHNKKEYSLLFENVRKIFVDNISKYFFNPKAPKFKKEISQEKKYGYEIFNDEYSKEFKKDIIPNEEFKVGDKVDVLIRYKKSKSSFDHYAWVRGIIIDIIDNEYVIEYPSDSKDSTINYPIGSSSVLKEGKKTEDWEWRLSLKENDIIDCNFNRKKWFPSTIYKVNEYKTKNGLIYKEYRVGFRLYLDHLVEYKEYDYNNLLQNAVIWDNPDNLVDEKGNSYFGHAENLDENIAFYSKKIQKYQKFTSIEREILSDQYNNIYSSYNSINTDNLNNINTMNIMSLNEKSGDERIKIMMDYIENDRTDKNDDDFFYYEKDGKKNIIITIIFLIILQNC